MKYEYFGKEPPVCEDEIKNNPMFWNYFFHYAFCQKHSLDRCQEIVDFAKEHYTLDGAWIQEFARPRTSPEKMTAPKGNYVRNLVYFPNTYFKFHYIRFYQDKIIYSGTLKIEEAKSESLSRMSFNTYSKAVASCGALSGILLAPMVSVSEEEMTEFRSLIQEGLKETTVPLEDYDTLLSLMMKYCKANERDRKGFQLSLAYKRYLAGATVLFIATMWFVSEHAYNYLGESGLYRAMVDSFSYIPMYLYIFGGVLYVLFIRKKNEEGSTKKRMRAAAICACLFLCILGWLASDGVLAAMDAWNLNRQMAKVNTGAGSGGRIKPWTWEGLEEITLEKPKVYINRSTGRNLQTYHTIGASNIRKRFKIPGNTSNAESLQKHIDNGETIIVYYYKHSRVVERICNGEYDILMGNTIYQLP